MVPAALLLLAAGCDRPPPDARDSAAARDPAATHDTPATGDSTPPLVAPDGRVVTGILFDPAAARPGMRVGELTIAEVDARPAAVDSVWVGTARFEGPLELTGAIIPHFEPDTDAVCFEADPASGARMPRWAGDFRRPWFCFENLAEARAALRGRQPGDSVRIVIERLVIHRGMSDEVNSARLVRLLD